MDQWRKAVTQIEQATGLPIDLSSCMASEWKHVRSMLEQAGEEIVIHTKQAEKVYYISIIQAKWSPDARKLLSLLLRPLPFQEHTASEQAADWLAATLEGHSEPIPPSLEAAWSWREARGCFLIERVHAERPADAEQWQQLLQNFLPAAPAPLLLPLSARYFLLLVAPSSLQDADLEADEKASWLHWAYTLHELLLAETMEMIRIGVSLPAQAPSQLPDRLRGCMHVLQAIKEYHPKELVAGSWQYPLEQWACSLAPAIRDTLRASLGEKLALTAEQQELLHALFSNQLNLSETARALYLHRNTLLYRLDKLKEKTGLDPREFSDAVFLQLVQLFRQNT